MHPPSFEDLIQSAAGDGTAVSLMPWSPPRVEVEDLMQAWSIERSRTIECEILLALSRAAIAQLLATERGASPDHLRDLRALLGRIDSQLDGRPPGRA